MITIVKDNVQKTVTKGAYKSFYEQLGYKVVQKDKKPELSTGVNEKPELSTGENEKPELKKQDLKSNRK